LIINISYRGAGMDNPAKIVSVLKKNKEPMRPGDIAEKAGIDSKEATKILGNLKKEGKVISPKRCFYSLP
jgi:Mn-dependent DtxR family transcriptional regulator